VEYVENTNPKSRFNCKRLIVICSIVLAVAIVIGAGAFVLDIFRYNTGVVRNISVKTKGTDEVELKMTYFLSMGGYSVREVPLDEGEYISDGMIDYNGGLGKYRIMVEFGDMSPHTSFIKRMSEDGIFEINHATVSFKAKIACPSDHGFVLYIGSDTPISVENISDNELNSFRGTIRIPIRVGNIE
jgi:hypothetical protein